MHEVLEKTLERKANYVKYKYHSASYQIDSALKYLLDKIAEIDGGKSADEFMKENDYVTGYKN